MRIVRTRIESAIGSAKSYGSVIEKDLANGIVKETETAKDPVVVTEVEDRGTTEAVAKISHMEIGAGTVIAIKTDIAIGEARHMITPQSWHASARGNEGTESERRKQLHTVYIFNYFYELCNYET